MRRYGIIYTIISICLTPTALHIEPPFPSTVPTGQPISFNWFRDTGDPPDFAFRKILSQTIPSETFPVDGDKDQQSGAFTLTFTQTGSFAVVAVERHDRDPHGGWTFFTVPGIMAQPPTSTTTGTPIILITSLTTTSPAGSDTSSGVAATLSEGSPSSSISSTGSSTGPMPTTSTSHVNPGSNPTATSTEHITPPPDSSAPTDPLETNSVSPVSPKKTKPIIIGSVIGGVVFILILLLLLLFFIRRRRSGLSRNTDSIGPNVFYRDKMVQALNRRISLTTHRREYTVEEGISNASPTTPLREDFDGDRDVDSADGHGVGVETLGSNIVGSQSLTSVRSRSISRARTDRQMQIEQKIFELQSRLITASPGEKEMIRERVDKLGELKNSDWAYGRGGSDDIPEVMKG